MPYNPRYSFYRTYAVLWFGEAEPSEHRPLSNRLCQSYAFIGNTAAGSKQERADRVPVCFLPEILQTGCGELPGARPIYRRASGRYRRRIPTETVTVPLAMPPLTSLTV
jgi:hypothetical protein